jgi:hypothetical protein
MDNNFTASPIEHFERQCKFLIKNKIKTDFQGVDIRLINDGKAELLAKVSLWKQMHFA